VWHLAEMKGEMRLSLFWALATPVRHSRPSMPQDRPGFARAGIQDGSVCFVAALVHCVRPRRVFGPAAESRGHIPTHPLEVRRSTVAKRHKASIREADPVLSLSKGQPERSEVCQQTGFPLGRSPACPEVSKGGNDGHQKAKRPAPPKRTRASSKEEGQRAVAPRPTSSISAAATALAGAAGWLARSSRCRLVAGSGRVTGSSFPMRSLRP
jgi:hypothetical protein